MPSKVEVAIADAADPPAAITPTTANCEPPENRSADRAWVCGIDKPEATDKAPKLTPYIPVAIPTESAWLRTARRRSSVSCRSAAVVNSPPPRP